jgi:hypothetical protein
VKCQVSSLSHNIKLCGIQHSSWSRALLKCICHCMNISIKRLCSQRKRKPSTGAAKETSANSLQLTWSGRYIIFLYMHTYIHTFFSRVAQGWVFLSVLLFSKLWYRIFVWDTNAGSLSRRSNDAAIDKARQQNRWIRSNTEFEIHG